MRKLWYGTQGVVHKVLGDPSGKCRIRNRGRIPPPSFSLETRRQENPAHRERENEGLQRFKHERRVEWTEPKHSLYRFIPLSPSQLARSGNLFLMFLQNAVIFFPDIHIVFLLLIVFGWFRPNFFMGTVSTELRLPFGDILIEIQKP